MKYISTRGGAAPLSFREAVITGLAADGGLLLPESLPDFSTELESWRDLPFGALFQRIVEPFIAGEITSDELRGLIGRSYGAFDHPEITPVVPVGPHYLVELFHGPTLAFKDIALQFLGNLFEHFLAPGGERLTIVGATSGDTGSAAIHALKGRRGIEVFILFPKGRVSPMQQRQMTTVPDANIHAVAVEGSFDDAQAIVKEMFNDKAFNARYGLGAVNSINWARVMAQIVYFFYAYLRLVELGARRYGEPVGFAVPTGNFGHIFAGYLARRMGLPVERLIMATNSNDILHRFVQEGRYRMGSVQSTHSPSMDIQLASNFERYLFNLTGGDGGRVGEWMESLRARSEFSVKPELMGQVRDDFLSCKVDDAQTLETIGKVKREQGYLLDPHSAIGFRAAQEQNGTGAPIICMATAHPAKFARAIEQATGEPPPLPPALAGLADLPERLHTLPARVEEIQEFIGRTLA